MAAKPVHFDVKAMETTLREMHRRTMVEVRARAGNDADRELIDMQERLFELLVQTNVILATFRNEGRDTGAVAQAFGSVIGLCAGAFVSNHPPEAREIFRQYYIRTLQSSLTGQSAPGSVGESCKFDGAIGGNA